MTLLGCSKTSKTTDNSSVEPGSASRPIGSLTYDSGFSTGTGDALGDPSPVSICQLAVPGQTVAIIEGLESPTVIPLGEDCSGPYSSNVLRGPVEVLAVAAGQTLPLNLTLVSISEDRGFPEKGETWLVSLRYLRGEWFLTEAIDIKIMDSTIEPTTEGIGELPSDFMDLSSQCESVMTNFAVQCESWSELAAITEAEWESRYFEPSASHCVSGSGEPDAGETHPSEPSDGDNNDGAPPDECTDSNPC